MPLSGYIFRLRVGLDSVTSDAQQAMVCLRATLIFVELSLTSTHRPALHFSNASATTYLTSELILDTMAHTRSATEGASGSQ
jgi:hypothetical protein